jgi:putative oxidoreductase
MRSGSCTCECRGSAGWKPAVLFVSRVLLALAFLAVGWSKFTDFSAAAAFVSNAGVPFPDFLTALIIALELGGAVFLILGFHPRITAALLALTAFISCVIFNGRMQTLADQVTVLQDLAIIGGLLQIVVHGGGSWRIPYVPCKSRRCPECSLDECGCCGDCGCADCKGKPSKRS